MKSLVRALIFALAVCTVASASPTHISGRVTYPNGAAAEYVRVQLWSDTISFRTESTTDKQGRYVFDGIPNSTFHLLIDLVGYQPIERTIDISMSGMAYEDIVLKPKPGTNPPAAALPATIDASIAAIPAEAKKEFEAGGKAMSTNDGAGAAQHYQKAIELYPNYAESYAALGFVQLQTAQKAADLQAAEASEVKALSIEKDMPSAYLVLGVARANLGNTPGAEEPLTTFVAKDPTNPDGHFELAKTEFALNKFPEAELHAKKAVELKEKNPGVQVILAYSLLR